MSSSAFSSSSNRSRSFNRLRTRLPRLPTVSSMIDRKFSPCKASHRIEALNALVVSISIAALSEVDRRCLGTDVWFLV